MARRAPMTDVIPLGQINTNSTLPRQGWMTVTVTATCSRVSIPDCLRSAAETDGEETERLTMFVCLTLYSNLVNNEEYVNMLEIILNARLSFYFRAH